MKENIKFDSCMEEIYSMISERCRIQKACNRMKSYEVLPSDRQLASYILSNTRKPKKNPYLITTTYFQDVCNNLYFESQSDMLWGCKEEWEAFGGRLFYLLITDILKSESPLKEQVETALNDYAPYAEANCYFPLLTEGVCDWNRICFNKDFTFEDMWELQRSAIWRLYAKIQYDFIDSYLDFFEHENTVKLNDKLNKFVTQCLPPILERERLNVTFPAGRLIQEVLNALIKLQPSEVQEIMFVPEDFSRVFMSEAEEDADDALSDFRQYNSEYVDRIIEIQRRLECESYERLLSREWNYCDFMIIN